MDGVLVTLPFWKPNFKEDTLKAGEQDSRKKTDPHLLGTWVLCGGVMLPLTPNTIPEERPALLPYPLGKLVMIKLTPHYLSIPSLLSSDKTLILVV